MRHAKRNPDQTPHTDGAPDETPDPSAPRDEKPTADAATTDLPEASASGDGKPNADAARGEKPDADAATAELPEADRARGEKANGDTLRDRTPGTGAPQGGKRDADAARGGKPDVDAARGEKAGAGVAGWSSVDVVGGEGPGALVGRVLGVAWFQVAGYVRSGQVLFPLVLLGLIIAVQSGMPANPGASFADAAAFALPVFALTTHQLLGAEPDAQRAVTVRNAGSRWAYLAAGLLAALVVNLGFLLLSTASALRGPLGGHVLVGGSLATTILVGLAVHVLTYLPGVALGALTTRTVTGDAPAEYVALAGGLLIAVLPGLASGPATWVGLPLFRLLRAANGHRLELAAPGIALHVAIWTAVVTTAYVLLRLRRRSA